MERRILTVCDNKMILNSIQQEWQKNCIFVCIVDDVREAVSKLSKNIDYLLVIIFSDGQEYISLLKTIRELTRAPILILDQQYDSAEKTTALKAGADEYIRWSDSYLEETIASGLALIRRYTELNQTSQQPFNIISRGTLLINVDYHRGFFLYSFGFLMYPACYFSSSSLMILFKFYCKTSL